MKRRDLFNFAGAFIVSSLVPGLSFAGDKMNGNWYGEIVAGVAKYQLRLELGPEQANLYSTKQANRAIVSDELQIHNKEIFIRFDEINAVFVGKFKGNKIIGKFSQGSIASTDFKIVLQRA